MRTEDPLPVPAEKPEQGQKHSLQSKAMTETSAPCSTYVLFFNSLLVQVSCLVFLCPFYVYAKSFLVFS